MISRNARLLVVLAVISLLAAPAFAGKAIPVVTQVVEFCTTTGLAGGSAANCQTDFGQLVFRGGDFWGLLPAPGTSTPPYLGPGDLAGFSYSVRPDGKGTYANLDTPVVDYVISEWGTNTAVYSLNTEATAVNGTYDSGSSRGARLHFFSTVEFPWLDPVSFPNDRLPPCWNNVRDHIVVINWSMFASEFITRLGIGESDMGFARMNFNMRQELSSVCDQQQARYRMTWQSVCFTRLPNAGNKRVWVATSDVCEGVAAGSSPNFGTALLEAYGGRKRETVSYGNWRMPFKVILTEQ